jgi:outer membrane protein TolC
MHLYGKREFEQQQATRPASTTKNRVAATNRLRATAALMLALSAGTPSAWAQQAVKSDLPAAPAPVLTEPLNLRDSARDFSKPTAGWLGGHYKVANPLKIFTGTSIDKASFVNSVRLSELVKDGKIYLSLSDALALALENNYDIAIARYNLDIADTDILRAKAGSFLGGVSTGIVSNTQSGSATASGGGPGGTTGGAGGEAAGSSGLVLTANGAGPTPQNLDPTVTGAIQFDRQSSVSTSFFTGGSTNTNTYDFTVDQGFVTGTDFKVAYNNQYQTASNPTTLISPQLNAGFKATITQHLLQGAGIWVNKRFVYQALNDRRITDSSFRQQILYTVNQVENIYWGLVQNYEDVQAKQRALEQSSKLLDDDKKQLEIGTMAPLDVVNAQATVASDKQALLNSQNSLNYQQQIIKQAIARNLNDPALMSAAIIPTDRVSLEPILEESRPVEELVQLAFQQRPELEQAVLAMKNNEISLKGAKNALLPTFDVFAYLGGSGVAGSTNPNCSTEFYGPDCAKAPALGGYGTAFQGAFNNTSPDKGLGFNITIPIRNRTAEAVQARALIEYRQSELRLQQQYTQIRMQVVNAQFALNNDRAQVLSAIAARDYAQQSLDAEQKKLSLGASTTATVLMQQKNLAAAENTLISAKAGYAKDRAGLYQTLANTLQHYGINLNDAANGQVKAAPVVPGLAPVMNAK